MKSPQLMPSGGNKQTGFTDEYCRMLIDQELAQITIRKTLNAFRKLLKIIEIVCYQRSTDQNRVVIGLEKLGTRFGRLCPDEVCQNPFWASQSDKFTSLDNFKNIKTMYVVNDENFEDVKANLSNLSESDVLTISVFKNAVAGILEEIQREKRDTLWLFCFLNASHPRYRQRDADDTDLFQSLLPLYQNDQVSFSDDY